MTVRVHWTDRPYRWLVNDGNEHVERLTPGRLCLAEDGDEHVAHPARILVVERKGSA